MCEILLCVHDRGTSGNQVVDCHAPKEGDVIVVQDDGWTWGQCELGINSDSDDPRGNHNFFRVIKLPNVTAAQLNNLLSREVDEVSGAASEAVSPHLQYRGFFLDKSKFHSTEMATLIAHYEDDTRKNPTITLPHTAAQLQAVVTKRPPVPYSTAVSFTAAVS